MIPKNGKAQAVPSSIALGPDGNIYVGELAEGAGKGKARVWRIPAAGGTPVVHATGFTTITGLAFGPDGSMFVTEFAQNLAKNKLRGELIRVAPDGTRTNAGRRQAHVRRPARRSTRPARSTCRTSACCPARRPRRAPSRAPGGTLVKITP